MGGKAKSKSKNAKRSQREENIIQSNIRKRLEELEEIKRFEIDELNRLRMDRMQEIRYLRRCHGELQHLLDCMHKALISVEVGIPIIEPPDGETEESPEVKAARERSHVHYPPLKGSVTGELGDGEGEPATSSTAAKPFQGFSNQRWTCPSSRR